VAGLPACASVERVSLFQTPDPNVPLPPTRTPSSQTPAPTATPGPAPSEDRVGFPEGYADEYKLIFVVDRRDNRTVRVVCGNEIAATTPEGEPFPYGSVLIMEIWRARVDEDGRAVMDENGRLIRSSLSSIFVMRKERGFGEAYQRQRTGEWEYVAYEPDGGYDTPPEESNSCAACHLEQASEEMDWIFRSELFFHYDDPPPTPVPGPNEVFAIVYAFVPQVQTVQAGTTVTWINHDELVHTVTAADRTSWDSGPLGPGDEFDFTFDSPGRYNYICTIHRGITAEIVVTE
jgi:hemoglobin